MPELIKDSDFNINVPYAWKKRKLKEANKALQALWRIELQIAHWMRMPDSNIDVIPNTKTLSFSLTT